MSPPPRPQRGMSAGAWGRQGRQRFCREAAQRAAVVNPSDPDQSGFSPGNDLCFPGQAGSEGGPTRGCGQGGLGGSCSRASRALWDPVGAAICPFREPRGPEAGEAVQLPLARPGWAPLWPSARPAHPPGPSGLTRLPVLVALLFLLSRQFSSQPLSLSLSSPALPPPIWKILPAPQVPLIMSLPFSGPFHVCSVFGDEVADPESRTQGEDTREPPGSPARSVAPPAPPLPAPPSLPSCPCVPACDPAASPGGPGPRPWDRGPASPGCTPVSQETGGISVP